MAADDFFKRAFDIGAASLGLLALAPILLVCAIGVRLSSPGPILFRQVRVGRHGKSFAIAKFRTMRAATASGGAQITVGDDARITHFGAFLRKWKLDELPQLWNVLVGEMSVVGPRPEVPKYVALYTPEMRRLVLSVRPGITDPSSIYMRNESAVLAEQSDPERYYVETLLPEKIRRSGEYAANRSFVGDLILIWKTFAAIVGPSGAACSGTDQTSASM